MGKRKKGARRRCFRGRKGDDAKQGEKDGDQTLRRLELEVADRLAKIAVIAAAKKNEPRVVETTRSRTAVAEAEATTLLAFKATDSQKRQVVKYFFEQLGAPDDEEFWGGVGGTISRIRSAMGASAPRIDTVRRTLRFLVDPKNADARERAGVGTRRKLSDEDDLYIGLASDHPPLTSV